MKRIKRSKVMKLMRANVMKPEDKNAVQAGVSVTRLIDTINELIDEVNAAKLRPKHTAIVTGKQMYDPRDGRYKDSDNPALILYDLIKYGFTVVGDDDHFLEGISDLADYCDKKNYHLNLVSVI